MLATIMTSAEANSPLREKHLVMIQGIISRMAGNSLETRKWTVSTVAAVIAFSLNKSSWQLALLGAVVAAVFWYLDSFYLYQERRFRSLFERIRHATIAQLEADPWFLNPDYNAGARSFPVSQPIPRDISVIRMAFRDGLIQLHGMAVLLPLALGVYLFLR